MIKVNPDRMDLVETRMIDGRQCLVIPVDDHIEVNGINVRTMKVKGVAGPKAGGSVKLWKMQRMMLFRLMKIN